MLDAPLVGESASHRALLVSIGRVAPSDVEVLITGPTGVGKELYARLINANTTLQLSVAVPPEAVTQEEKAALEVLENLRGKPAAGMLLDWRPAGETAEQRLFLGDGHLWFLPPNGEIIRQGKAKTPSISLTGKSAEQVSKLVLETLRTIAKATNLLKVASMAGISDLSRQVEISPFYERNGKPIEASSSVQVPALRDGDKVNVRIQNKSLKPIDVNFLFIDSRYEVSHIKIERIGPFGDAPYPLGTVRSAKTVGRESVLMIVTQGADGVAPQDFRFLGQAGLSSTRSNDNGLQGLLERAGFTPERMRELDSANRTAREAVFRVFAWDTTSND